MRFKTNWISQVLSDALKIMNLLSETSVFGYWRAGARWIRVGHHGNRGCRSGHHSNRGSRSWQQWRAIAITILPSLNWHFSCTHCAVNCHTTQPIFTCLQHNIIIITQLIIQTQHVVGTNETSFNFNYIFQLSKKLFLQQHQISNNLFGRRP